MGTHKQEHKPAGRITLTLTTRTIKALRMLALPKEEIQNEVAETLLIAGGLHNAVDNEWSAGKPDQPKPTAPAPIQAAPTPPKPANPRDGWMPEVPKVTDDEEVSPYMKDGKVSW